MKKEFTKSDLKNGMVVETRNKTRFLVNGDILVGKWNDWDELENYEDDLTVFGEKDDECDIVKAHTTNSYYIEHMFDDDNLILIWERKDEMETKKYIIEQEYIDEDYKLIEDITILPNNSRGYHHPDSNHPISIMKDGDFALSLTIDSAKEMIKSLQEIVAYMGGERI